jgi:LysM repeat protein
VLSNPQSISYTNHMTPLPILPASVLTVLLVSCASQQPAENYDTPGNPYGPPNAGYADSSSYPGYGETNPAYDTPAIYEETTTVRPPFDSGSASSTAAPTTPSTPATVHTVISGDTLWGLSRQYGVSIEAIKQANNMTRDVVVLGQRLQIPSR